MLRIIVKDAKRNRTLCQFVHYADFRFETYEFLVEIVNYQRVGVAEDAMVILLATYDKWIPKHTYVLINLVVSCFLIRRFQFIQPNDRTIFLNETGIDKSTPVLSCPI